MILFCELQSIKCAKKNRDMKGFTCGSMSDITHESFAPDGNYVNLNRTTVKSVSLIQHSMITINWGAANCVKKHDWGFREMISSVKHKRWRSGGLRFWPNLRQCVKETVMYYLALAWQIRRVCSPQFTLTFNVIKFMLFLVESLLVVAFLYGCSF